MCGGDHPIEVGFGSIRYRISNTDVTISVPLGGAFCIVPSTAAFVVCVGNRLGSENSNRTVFLHLMSFICRLMFTLECYKQMAFSLTNTCQKCPL